MNEDHTLIEQENTGEKKAIISQDQELKETKINLNKQNIIWPVEPNIMFEEINYNYEQKILMVKLTNLSIETINIIQTGVKYDENQSIDFQKENINLDPGENIIYIAAPHGNPYKFVIRTSFMTGAGEIRKNNNW